MKISTKLFKALVYKDLGAMLRRLAKNYPSKLNQKHKTKTKQQDVHSLA